MKMALSEEVMSKFERMRSLIDIYLGICETIEAKKHRIHGLDLDIPRKFELKLKAKCEDLKAEIQSILNEILESWVFSLLMQSSSEIKGKNKWIIALRDAIIVFLISLTSNLLTYGYPPSYEGLYMSILTALLMFALSLAHAWKVQAPERKPKRRWEKVPLEEALSFFLYASGIGVVAIILYAFIDRILGKTKE